MRRLSRSKRWLVALYLLGAVNVVPGSFASFSAELAVGATFATGSMVLENKMNGEARCLSNGDLDSDPTDVNANECPAMFTLTGEDPGGSDFRKVRLENVGTVDASSLALHWTGPGTCATSDAPGETYHGSGDLCGELRLYVQEYADDPAWDANDRTGGTCWYGDVGDPTDCGFQNNRDLAHFSATYGSSAPLEMGPLPAGGARFFRVYLSLRGAADNTVQGRSVDFGLTWTISQ